jgi:pilus assembly protein Flp/PilA
MHRERAFLQPNMWEGVKTNMWNDIKTRILSLTFAVKAREEGQALVEYGLILALIAVVCVGALTALGLGVEGLLEEIVGGL